MKHKTDYLFHRPDSKFWQLKLQSPDGRKELSLRTTDRAQAEVLALPLIAEHKRKLLERLPHVTAAWKHELEPNREHAGPDGGRIIALQHELIHINRDGAVIKTTPNGVPAFRLIGGPFSADMLREAIGDTGSRPTVATKNGDDDLIEMYLKERNVTGYSEKETRDTWALFRELCPGVKLKDATRDHGRKLATHLQGQGRKLATRLQGQGVKSATVQHKVARLTAVCNFAIKEGKLTFNPFSGVVPKVKDALRRVPLTDDDMRLIRDNLDKLTASDKLMVRTLATTGMRLGETFQINGEAKERGVRYVMIVDETKNEQSMRRVPLPAKLLPHLPPIIKGQLFPDDDSHCASTRLNRFLRQIGITDKAKVIHSLRHRAQDRLRAAECPEDIRWAILGHEERTVAAGYGEGFAVPVLKRWIDRIGF
jgi:integrase